jgi:hypothetical protein
MKPIDELRRDGWKIFGLDENPKLNDVVVVLIDEPDVAPSDQLNYRHPTIGVWRAWENGSEYLDVDGPGGDYFCWGLLNLPRPGLLSACVEELDDSIALR